MERGTKLLHCASTVFMIFVREKKGGEDEEKKVVQLGCRSSVKGEMSFRI